MNLLRGWRKKREAAAEEDRRPRPAPAVSPLPACADAECPAVEELRVASESLPLEAVVLPRRLESLLGLPPSPGSARAAARRASSTKEEVCTAFAAGARRRRLSDAEQRQAETRRAASLELHREEMRARLGRLAHGQDPTDEPREPAPPAAVEGPSAAGGALGATTHVDAADRWWIPAEPGSGSPPAQGLEQPHRAGCTASGMAAGGATPKRSMQTPAEQQLHHQQLSPCPTRFFTPASELPSPESSSELHTTVQFMVPLGCGMELLTAAFCHGTPEASALQGSARAAGKASPAGRGQQGARRQPPLDARQPGVGAQAALPSSRCTTTSSSDAPLLSPAARRRAEASTASSGAPRPVVQPKEGRAENAGPTGADVRLLRHRRCRQDGEASQQGRCKSGWGEQRSPSANRPSTGMVLAIEMSPVLRDSF